MHPMNNITSNAIQSAQSSVFVGVICVDNGYHPSCRHINFDFNECNEVTIIGNNADSIS